MERTPRIGLIVNPIAGIGGAIGMKGSDGPEALAKARAVGHASRSSERATAAIGALRSKLGASLAVVTPPGQMGADSALAAGVTPKLLDLRLGGLTTSADTRTAAAMMLTAGVDLLLFAGGDGTARDICDAIGESLPALGIPTGVKMHSAVFATTPRAAGEAAAAYLGRKVSRTTRAEVMDIDEDAFRNGRVSARFFGMLQIPDQPGYMQHLKSGSAARAGADLVGIADDVIERMGSGELFILGPGTTTKAIADRLGIPKTLLGVDLVCRGEPVAFDVTEQQILAQLNDTPARIVVTPIGGQGFILGRGNQQISPRVIEAVGRDRLLVVAAKEKLARLMGEPLLVDTGDPALDQALAGYMRVVTGYHQESVQAVR